jgi:hypothetical protein
MGNLLSKGGDAFVYDGAGRLSSITRPSNVSVTNLYNGKGERSYTKRVIINGDRVITCVWRIVISSRDRQLI